MANKAKGKSRVALEGKLESPGELIDVINMIHGSRWTGALLVVTDDARRTVFFKDGDVRAASSDAPEERLGEIMCRHGAITRAQLDEALAELADQKRLGTVLAERRIITTHDLYFFIREQMQEIFFALLLVEEGHFYFQRRDLPESLPAQLLLLSTDLLLSGMERSAELARFRQAVPSQSIVFERGTDVEDEELLAGPAKAVLDGVDGQATLEEVARRACLGEYHATEAAFELLEMGAIRPAGAHRRITAGGDPQRLLLADLIGTFNGLFSSIHEKAEAQGRTSELEEAASSFFSEGTVHPALFRGVTVGKEGELDPVVLLENVSRAQVGDPGTYLYSGLNEFLFFASFVVGAAVDDATERRLKDCFDEICLLHERRRTRS